MMTMWVLNKFITTELTDGGCTHIPNLKVKEQNGATTTTTITTEATTNEEKSKDFFNVFFKPPAKESHVPNFAYNKPKEQFREIMGKQIHRGVEKLPHTKQRVQTVSPTQ